jgi:hypothetical protein
LSPAISSPSRWGTIAFPVHNVDLIPIHSSVLFLPSFVKWLLPSPANPAPRRTPPDARPRAHADKWVYHDSLPTIARMAHWLGVPHAHQVMCHATVDVGILLRPRQGLAGMGWCGWGGGKWKSPRLCHLEGVTYQHCDAHQTKGDGDMLTADR